MPKNRSVAVPPVFVLPRSAWAKLATLAAGLVLVLSSCGSPADTSASLVEATAAVDATSTQPAPTAPAAPAATTMADPTAVPTATAVPEPTPTPVPTATAVPEPTATVTTATVTAEADELDEPDWSSLVDPATLTMEDFELVERAPTTIEMIDSGTEPRALLRGSELLPGFRADLESETYFAQKQTIEKTLTLDAELTTTQASGMETFAGPEGSVVTRFTYGAIRVAGPDRALNEAARAGSAELEGAWFDLLATPAGEVIGFRSDLPPVLRDQLLLPILAAMGDGPTEPVGAGASWRLEQVIDSGGGFFIVQTTLVQLESIDDETITVTSMVEQRLGDDGFDIPGLGPVDGSYDGEGTGSSVIHRASGLPLEMRSETTNTSVIEAGPGQTVETDTQFVITLTSEWTDVG